MIALQPIATIRNSRRSPEDDRWGDLISTIDLVDPLGEDAFDGVDDFSHVEIVFWFHLVGEETIETGARHPREDPKWPCVGILAQRARHRPNRIGTTIARIVRRVGRTLYVEGLDAVDGTPVLDIKPVMREFLPREQIRQPAWATELMRDYWAGEPPA